VVRSCEPTIWNLLLSVEPAPGTSENECVSPGSGSPADSVPTAAPIGAFSATLAFESATPVGA
jgi:hypothetical protein